MVFVQQAFMFDHVLLTTCYTSDKSFFFFLSKCSFIVVPCNFCFLHQTDALRCIAQASKNRSLADFEKVRFCFMSVYIFQRTFLMSCSAYCLLFHTWRPWQSTVKSWGTTPSSAHIWPSFMIICWNRTSFGSLSLFPEYRYCVSFIDIFSLKCIVYLFIVNIILLRNSGFYLKKRPIHFSDSFY